MSNINWPQLIEAAIRVAEHAYIPYSNYPVGAALLTATGEIITGCNVENSAFGETICAERTAVLKAVSEGHRQFVALAVATKNIGSPCGSCRQVLREFSLDLPIVLCNFEGEQVYTSLAELLPRSFGPEWL